MQRKIAATLILVAIVAANASGQGVTTQPSGDNQKSSVTQHIGPVRVTIDYSSPDVHAPNGDDRRGKIWGTLVPYGLTDLGFGTCKQCPWRAGANENTVFTVSHDVMVEGKPLPAGKYGLHMIADPNEWTVIFSNNSTSWGSYYYDETEDALRVKVKPARNEYHEWLTYEFTDRGKEKATVALMWEDLKVPFSISVPNITDLYLAGIRRELRSEPGFAWQSWNEAARFAQDNKRLDDALEFAQVATSRPFIGQENFQTLMTLADIQDAKSLPEAKASREKALSHATASATDLHQYGRRLMNQKKKDEAIKVWELNARRHPNMWPVNVGLMRAHSAGGRYKEALKYAKLALAQAPDEANKKSLTDAVKKLEQNQDVN